ncbi:hypothetical protein VspSTUT11_20100 [Vibrio sp. STUT-A11]|nr:hypothetical protein VspSTUT11_20100 [Vibrio sp. STUT-A11]
MQIKDAYRYGTQNITATTATISSPHLMNTIRMRKPYKITFRSCKTIFITNTSLFMHSEDFTDLTNTNSMAIF